MFSGSLVAIVTPMHADGGLDFSAWGRLIDFHIENGTSGIVVAGTTGESASLSDDELLQLTQRACDQAHGRIQIIAGAGSSSTAATVERVRRVSQLPLDGVLIVTPAYNRPTQEGLFRHYAAVAAASRVPVIAYNVPSRTAVDMLPATVGRIAQLPRVVAVKEAVAQVSRVRELLAQVPAAFTVLSGDDASACDVVLAGARGVISVTANVAPRAMAAMVAAAVKGDAEGARQLDAGIAALHENLFLETNPIPAKWALARMGLMGPGLRLPLTDLAEPFRAPLEQALRQSGALR
ncbi:MAG TPA: 4-hydroxy-tetrahydrodipicolinate synthase [Steroidobacteraceae bacterium]|nr:4-hydroxy-tetrahydrodipicolinate synthase [Steroidobacteraceae bacterium]